MKYYDGMGRDVTAYVAKLEKTVEELKAQISVTKPTEEPIQSSEAALENVEVMENVAKPKTVRRKRKVANP